MLERLYRDEPFREQAGLAAMAIAGRPTWRMAGNRRDVEALVNPAFKGGQISSDKRRQLGVKEMLSDGALRRLRVAGEAAGRRLRGRADYDRSGGKGNRVYLAEETTIDATIDGLPVETLVVGVPEKHSQASALTTALGSTEQESPAADPAGSKSAPDKTKAPSGFRGLQGIGNLAPLLRPSPRGLWKEGQVFSQPRPAPTSPLRISTRSTSRTRGVDAGCVKLLADVKATAEINDIGAIKGTMKANRDQRVLNRAASRLTEGKVDATEVTIVFGGDASPPDQRQLGLSVNHFALVAIAAASSWTRAARRRSGLLMGGALMTYVNPINLVLSELGDGKLI